MVVLPSSNRRTEISKGTKTMRKLLLASAAVAALAGFVGVVHAEDTYIPYSVTPDGYWMVRASLGKMTHDVCMKYRVVPLGTDGYALCIPATIAYTHHLHEGSKWINEAGTFYHGRFGPKDRAWLLAHGAFEGADPASGPEGFGN
jgi:hypothetical protein